MMCQRNKKKSNSTCSIILNMGVQSSHKKKEHFKIEQYLRVSL